MARPESGRRLIVNADDFGRSRSINQAVIRAHQEGILTTTSLMVNEPGAQDAVRLARENPKLGVGLHLSLICGRSALKPTEIPGLTDERYRFSRRPALAGMRYFLSPRLRSELRKEIHAQFERFRLTGLPLDHVNGHLHLHPTVFSLLRHHARKLGIQRFRLTRDPFWLSVRLSPGRWFYRVSHAVVFGCLAWRARGPLARLGIRHTDAVFGLLQDGVVDEEYLLRLLPALPRGDSELYSHPSMNHFKHELDALISPRVKDLTRECGINLIRYQDL